MNKKVKAKLTRIGKTEKFQSVFQKLTTNNELTYDEKSYVLATAILYIRHYEKNRSYKTYADIAYYIILKYSQHSKCVYTY